MNLQEELSLLKKERKKHEHYLIKHLENVHCSLRTLKDIKAQMNYLRYLRKEKEKKVKK